MERFARDYVSEVDEGEDNLHAVHWAVPEGWAEEGFDDPESDPVFIWSDNLVLVRGRIGSRLFRVVTSVASKRITIIVK
jgi:hypothetical protein